MDIIYPYSSKSTIMVGRKRTTILPLLLLRFTQKKCRFRGSHQTRSHDPTLFGGWPRHNSTHNSVLYIKPKIVIHAILKAFWTIKNQFRSKNKCCNELYHIDRGLYLIIVQYE